jgi:hypothetical protein
MHKTRCSVLFARIQSFNVYRLSANGHLQTENENCMQNTV